MNLSRLAYYQIAAVGTISIIGILLISLTTQGTDYTKFGDHLIVHEGDASLGPVEIDSLYSFDERAGDAQLPFGYLKVYDGFIDTERNCEFCIRAEYVPGPQGVAGMSFKNDRGFDLSTVKKVTFYAMGQEGGEVIKFKAAGKTVDKKEISDTEIFKNVKFDKTTKEVTLTKDWKKMEIDLSKSDLKGITHPFGFEISKDKNNAGSVIYIKGVKYDFDPATNPLQ